MSAIQCVCGTKVPLKVYGDGSLECRVCGLRYKAMPRLEPDQCACGGGRPRGVVMDRLECWRCGVAVVGRGEEPDIVVRWNRMQLALSRGNYDTLLVVAELEAQPEKT